MLALKNTAAGLATATAHIIQDDTGVALELPVLLADTGPLDGLLNYQLLFHERSRAWHIKLCQAVRLLLEYAAANAGAFERPRELFQSFSVRLLSGTFGADGLDSSGLYWLPRSSANARKLIGLLTELSQWLSREYGTPELAPLRETTRHEQVLAAAAWAYRNNASFLGHAESRARAAEALRWTRHLPRPRPPRLMQEEVIRFPADRFGDLLFRGFVHSQGAAVGPLRINLRDALITVMMHGAGVRLSECFHLWVGDVQEHPLDPTVAWVRIGHPTHGLTKWTEGGKTIEGTRAEFLAKRGLRPRNLIMGKKHAGWKNPALDGKWYLELHWSEPDYGRLFLRLWQLYLRQIVGLERRHPYAWVTFRGRLPGDMFTISEYKKAHERAVRLIGLVPGRANGTRPHGHRHDYGQRLADAGVSPRVVRKCMHHASLTSQLVYTQPDHDRMTRELDVARSRMAAGAKLDLAQLQQKYLSDVGLMESCGI